MSYKPYNSRYKNRYRVKSPIKSFRDLEVYQTTIQLSNELTSLEFLKSLEDYYDIKKISETIPKLIAESYGDKFESLELANKKLSHAITLITNVITGIDLLREMFSEDKEKKEILDKLLTKYSYQRRKVLNLKKAWNRVFSDNKGSKNEKESYGRK